MTMTNELWGPDWAEVRRNWIIDPNISFLNHGSFGATPRPVLAEQTKWRERLEQQPIDFLIRKFPAALTAARAACADFLHTTLDRLVFVPNATFAINHVAKSLPLGPGDEILVTNQVYPAVYHTMKRLGEHCGATLVMQPVPLPQSADPAPLAEAFLNGLTPRTKFVIIETIASATSLVLPAQQIVAECRRRGIWCLVDAAHSPGMFAVNLKQLDPDFWTGNYHKWACAPKVSAGLYVKPQYQEMIKPVITSNFAGRGFAEEFMWTGTADPAAYLATPAALEFMANLGWERLRRHNHALVRYGRDVVAEAVGTQIPIFDSPEFTGSMALVALPESFPIHSETEAEAFRTAFYENTRIETTFLWWDERAWIRLSAQVYNAPAEYDRLAAALRTLPACPTS